MDELKTGASVSQSSTSQPVTNKRAIQIHYDQASFFYWLLWGPHVHHGLFESDESPAQAQLQLTHRLADLAEISRGMRVLDVGCGMAGSSIELAKRHECEVVGITLSPFQRFWGAASTRWHGVHRKVLIIRQDAEEAVFSEASFDVVWSIECTEHLFDKQAFFRQTAKWLKPGGRLAICAWLAGDEPRNAARQRLVDQVCRGFLCPSLGTAAEYEHWFQSAGLKRMVFEDWTSKVIRTWEICDQRVRRSGVRWLAPIGGRSMRQFLADFATILEAYRTGAMRYGCFVASRD